MRRSARLPSDLHPSDLASRLAAVTGAVDLTVSNPTVCDFDYPVALLCAALADRSALIYEPAPLGRPETRAAIAAASRTGVAADDVVVTASTSESYALLFKLLCDPAERVAVLRPSYPLVEHLARLEGLEAMPVGLYYTGDTGRWALDLAALETALSHGARAVVVVNPNNPTGSCLSAVERSAVRGLCRQYGAVLIADEVFGPYGFSEAPLPSLAPETGEDAPLTVILDGLSKRGGLPQVKLGWMELHGPAADRQQARQSLEWLADMYLSVATPIQVAAPRLLPALEGIREQIAGRVRSNRAYLARSLVGLPEVDMCGADGGWYTVIRVPQILSEADWVLCLAERHGVILHPGFFYDFTSGAHLVLSLLLPPTQLGEGIARLSAGLHDVIHSE